MFGTIRPVNEMAGSLAMRNYYVITIHPELIGSYSSFGAVRAAAEQDIAKVEPIALRDFAVDRHGSVDDRPYGGGDSMVLRPEPLANAVNSLPQRPIVVLTSPAGKQWSQRDADFYAQETRPIAFICGRFAGVDQRFIDTYVDVEYSCGDVILTGGELPALMMIDSIVRLLPGTLGNPESASLDSFTVNYQGGLEHSLYTRPAIFEGHGVPSVLMSGDHKAIAEWRSQDARERTRRRRPDLLLNES